jgi:hypothetical protein
MTAVLTGFRDLIQRDVGGRGLATDPASNLLTACASDYAAACRSLADTSHAAVAIVTGFFIPHAKPPAAETDGPLGALFLARALTPLGIRVALLTDDFCHRALAGGLAACGLGAKVPLLTLPDRQTRWRTFIDEAWLPFLRDDFLATHLIALERVGPSHTPKSIRRQPGGVKMLPEFLADVPEVDHNRCHNMRGVDITRLMAPAHRLFKNAPRLSGLTTIGIGDGGNEIGMGKIPWKVIQSNIPRGGKIACRIATDWLIVAGISNWGAYGLAAGVWHLRGQRPPRELFDKDRERELLHLMVQCGPLVDGVSGEPGLYIDGLAFEEYAAVLDVFGDTLAAE